MEFLRALGVDAQNIGSSTGSNWLESTGPSISSYSPVDGKLIGSVQTTDKAAYEAILKQAGAAFLEWRQWPAPRRGEIVRQVGEALRAQKENLGKLVSYEMGKACRKDMVRCRK